MRLFQDTYRVMWLPRRASDVCGSDARCIYSRHWIRDGEGILFMDMISLWIAQDHLMAAYPNPNPNPSEDKNPKAGCQAAAEALMTTKSS